MTKRRYYSFIQWGLAALCPIIMFIITSCDSGSSNDNGSSSDDSDDNSETFEAGAVIIDTNEFVDPLIRPFLDSFIAELQERQISADLSNISIEFVDDFGPDLVGLSEGGTIAGLCFFDTGLIQIDALLISNPSFLFEVIYHELGHCVLGMEHRENSLMSEIIPRATPALVDEFFTEEFFFENDVLSSPGSLEPHAAHLFNLF